MAILVNLKIKGMVRTRQQLTAFRGPGLKRPERRAMDKVLIYLEEYIGSNWSASPSAPMRPPGVVESDLSSSIGSNLYQRMVKCGEY